MSHQLVGNWLTRSGMGGAESVQTINQLLTEMDGFDDNTGVVVMAATNRPAALDSALTRPGRFDRVIHLPLPNLEVRPAERGPALPCLQRFFALCSSPRHLKPRPRW